MNKHMRKPHLSLAVMLGVCLIMVGCVQESSAIEEKTEADVLAASAMCGSFVLGVVVDGEMRVVDLDAGSIAEKAGIQRGDILQSLDGAPFVAHGESIKELLSQKTMMSIGACNDVIIIDEDTGQVVNPQPPLQQPIGVAPLRLVLRRGEQDLQVEVDLSFRTSGSPEGTPTPMMPEQGLFYF